MRGTRDLWLVASGACGILSPLFLIIAVLAGGALREGYDPVRDSISELYEASAPNASWLMVLFTIYHALVIPLAVGLYRGLPSSHSRWRGPLLLGMAGVLGVPLGSYARCDPGCFGATTFRGQLHGILVLATVALIFSAMYAIKRSVEGKPGWLGYVRYTNCTLIAGLAAGVVMIPFATGHYAGLLERIAVAIILQWYLVSGTRLMMAGYRKATHMHKGTARSSSARAPD